MRSVLESVKWKYEHEKHVKCNSLCFSVASFSVSDHILTHSVLSLYGIDGLLGVSLFYIIKRTIKHHEATVV